MRVITLRNLPPALERQLADTAQERGWSLSQTVIRLLEERLAGKPAEPRTGQDAIDSLAGSWTAEETEEFVRAVALARRVDRELWE